MTAVVPMLCLSFSLLLVATVPVSLAHPSGGGGGDGANAVYRLLVLHTNDMHSHFDPIDGVSAHCVKGAVADGGAHRSPACYGGFARLKTAVERARSGAAPSAAPPVDGTLFLNAGDTFQGTSFYTYLKWPAVAQMVGRLGIDAMSLGNHEFDDGVNDVQSFIQNITIPVVASNLDLSDEPSLAKEPNLMKSKVLTVNGRKIGIIGYLTRETTNTSRVGKVKILPEIPSITAEAKRLKKDGVSILIALGHSGFNVDVQIAQQVEDIDLVIGGHTNTFLYTGNPPDIDKPVGKYPYLVEQPTTRRKVPVVQAFHNTKYLGNLWIEFDEAGEVVKSYGNPILLDSNIGQDPDLSKLVSDYEKVIENKTVTVIGTTSVFLYGTDAYCRFGECNLGNLITDSFVNYNLRNIIKSIDLTKSWTDAPIAVMQGGGIRSNINHMARNGKITFGDLVSTVPFRNDVGKITTNGSGLWQAFEYSVRRYSTTTPYGEFLQVSGLKVVFDLSQPSGERVRSIRARCGDCVVPEYRDVDPNANYTILMTNYLSEGGDGIVFSKIVDYRSIGTSEIDILVSEIGRKSPIRPEIEHRTVLLNADKLQEVPSGQPGSTILPSNPSLLLTVAVMSLVNLLP